MISGFYVRLSLNLGISIVWKHGFFFELSYQIALLAKIATAVVFIYSIYHYSWNESAVTILAKTVQKKRRFLVSVKI